MASNHVLLSAAVLLAILAAAMATHVCVPGMGDFPVNPLPSCRDYVIQQSCGTRYISPGGVASKEACCRELANITSVCRCTAVSYFMKGMATLLHGSFAKNCSYEALNNIAQILVSPAVCNLRTITGGPFC